MNKPKSTCFQYKDREVGCHSKCEKYIEFKKLSDEYNDNMRKSREEQSSYDRYKTAIIRKTKKR